MIIANSYSSGPNRSCVQEGEKNLGNEFGRSTMAMNKQGKDIIEAESVDTCGSCCSACGLQFRYTNDRLRMDERSFICESCYQNMLFPEVVVRCSELPD